MKDNFITGWVSGLVVTGLIVFLIGKKIETTLIVTGISKDWLELNHDYQTRVAAPNMYQIGDTLELTNKRIIETYGFRTF